MTTIPYSQWYLYEPPYRRWGYEARPLPPNAQFVPFYEEGKYDVAILHVDGECADPQGSKGTLYRKMNEIITDIPKIVINHGTPYLPEVFYKYFRHINDEEVQFEQSVKYAKDNMKAMIGNNKMIVNSKKAANDWGFGQTIYHGIYGNPEEEYLDIQPKEVRVVVAMSPAGWGYYYNRQYTEAVRNELKEQGVEFTQLRVDKKCRDFDEYRDYIGRSLISFFPMRESPMPRSRTEHMLSGGCVVTTPCHDAGELFESLRFKTDSNGRLIRDEHGQIIPASDVKKAEVILTDPNRVEDAVAKIIWLLDHPNIAYFIGQNGKKKAQEIYSMERYRHDWYQVFKEVGVL